MFFVIFNKTIKLGFLKLMRWDKKKLGKKIIIYQINIHSNNSIIAVPGVETLSL